MATTFNTVAQAAEAVQVGIYAASGPDARDFSNWEAQWCAQMVHNYANQLGARPSEIMNELSRLGVDARNLDLLAYYVRNS